MPDERRRPFFRHAPGPKYRVKGVPSQGQWVPIPKPEKINLKEMAPFFEDPPGLLDTRSFLWINLQQDQEGPEPGSRGVVRPKPEKIV